MKQIAYTVSATGHGINSPGTATGEHVEFFEPYKKALLHISDIAQKNIKEACKRYDARVDVLYNAHYEPHMVNVFTTFDNYHFDKVHADSGGLQIVTAGHTVTPEIRQEIYKVQSYADLAMCFDVIPLKSTSVERSSHERALISNKIFVKEEFDDAGKATARNIKEQISAFRSLGARTKVIIIAQGNTAKYMLEFFRRIQDVLEPDDYEYIGGLAVADTCMGNGPVESIEMLKAARLIGTECHPAVRRQLHLLGVGSLDRLRPAIYLLASGYLDAYEKLSYDSSTHTSSFDFGRVTLNGKLKRLGSFKTPEGEQHFRNCYQMFQDAMKPVCTEDEFIDLLYGPGKYGEATTEWKYSLLRKRAKAVGNPQKGIAPMMAKPMHTLYQVDNFCKNVDKVFVEHNPKTNSKKAQNYIRNLKKVRDDTDMDDWFDAYFHVTKSKRIKTIESKSFGAIMNG